MTTNWVPDSITLLLIYCPALSWGGVAGEAVWVRLLLKDLFRLLVITRRRGSDDAHAHVCSRQRPLMCTVSGILEFFTAGLFLSDKKKIKNQNFRSVSSLRAFISLELYHLLSFCLLFTRSTLHCHCMEGYTLPVSTAGLPVHNVYD